MKKKIFVYGTLRKGMYNYDIYLRDEDSFRSFGYIEGSLFSLYGRVYPAFLQEGHDMIVGEIHEVEEDTLKLIDELECYYGENNRDNEYNKVICDIYDQNHHIIDRLPVYVFNMDNSSNISILNDLIECHDYVQYMLKKEPSEKSVFAVPAEIE